MAAKTGAQKVTIKAPRFREVVLTITGVTVYVQNRFSAKARQVLIDTHTLGSQAKKGGARAPKDFDALWKEATHRSAEGWAGIPCSAFRAGAISACRLVGYKMTIAKLTLSVESDGVDADDETPLVRITKGEPSRFDAYVRNRTGVCDIRSRPRWQPGWQADVRVRFDEDQFSAEDVINLFERIGQQVGIGDGRPDSKASPGMGWGLFTAASQEAR